MIGCYKDLGNGGEQLAAPGQRESGITCRVLSESDHHYSVELQRIIDARPNLSIESRLAIATLVDAVATK
jgi:hypothetical protein